MKRRQHLIPARRYVPIVLVGIFALSLLYAALAFSKLSDEEINDVFTSAESLFKFMKEKNYPAIWRSLTSKTQLSIVDAVYKASRKSNADLDREQIKTDLSEGGELAKAYWTAYLNVFDPDTVLEQSKWNIGTIDKDTAEIIILYKKSPNPAILKLYREDNAWKVGLEETFGARNLLLF
jgi:hypothetical protein